MTATDGVTTEMDSVLVTVNQNEAPISSAGPDQTVTKGQIVTLDGNGSTDPDNGPNLLSYSWTQVSPASPLLSITGENQVQANFDAPDVTMQQVFVFQLMVSDGEYSSSDQVSIVVNDTPSVALPDGIVSVSPDTRSTVDAASVTTIDIHFNRAIYQDMWITGTLDLYKEGNILVESIDPLASHRINSQILSVPLSQALEPSTNYYIITSGSKWCGWTDNGPPWYVDPIKLDAWVFTTQ